MWVRGRGRARPCRPKGQALVEYAVVTSLLLGFGAVVLTQCVPALVGGLDAYLHGFYFVLSLPFP